MVCLEIRLNGRPHCTAGLAEPSRLEAMVNYDSEKRIDPDGLSPPRSAILTVVAVGRDGWAETLAWPRAELKVGDEVVIRVVERESADPARKMNVVDPAERERMERRMYEKLRLKFDPPAGG